MSETPGNVYFGRHMSITSEMLVRYEDFLAAVDGNNHTVTLKRVRCLGTEDRHSELKIDPVQETFAEITFSAKSIQEMHLLPTLDETKSFFLSADPAIMSIDAKKRCPPYDNKFDQTIGEERKHMPSKDNWRNGPAKPQYYAYQNQTYNGEPWNNSVPFRRPEPFQRREYVNNYVPKLLREALHTEAKQESPLSLFSLAQELSAKPAFSSSDTDSGSTTDDGKTVKGDGRGFANPCFVGPRPFGFSPKNDYLKNQVYAKPRFGSEHFVARPGHQQGMSLQKVAKFNADYDFETANRMFAEIAISDPKDIKDDKSESVPKPKDVQPADKDVKENKVFYSKSAFFDDISSDDKDRRSGKEVRPDWHSQRKTDGETFGPGTQEVISRHAGHHKDILQRQAPAHDAAH